MAQICVSLREETVAGAIQRMKELGPLADMFEIRGDIIRDLDLLNVLRGKTRPLLFACRSVAQGGYWDGPEDRRRMMLLEAVKRGYEFVDVEYECEHIDVMMEKSGAGLVVSHHDFAGVPEDLDGLYAGMTEKGADITKIAVTPQNFAEVVRLVEFIQRTCDCGGPQLVCIAMGRFGAFTRVLAGRYNAPFTFASQAEGSETAPGQVPVGLMVDLYRAGQVSPATRVYGVVGAEVTRSLSPILHNRAFEARGIDAVYVPFNVDDLRSFVEAIPALDLAGCSITRPYKTDILPLLGQVDETAAMCESVNTVVVSDGTLAGSTTDGVGVTAPLKRRTELKDKNVVIIGAGGAARAAALALLRKGAKVTVLARDEDKAAFVGEALNCAHGDLASLRNHEWDVLINATPVGSREAPDETPVPAGLHRIGTIVFDMVYDPRQTRLLREAEAAGCVVIGGLEMLLAQAAAQFETWTGQEAPVEVMKATAQALVEEA